MLTLLTQPPFLTVQDLGRPHHRHEGVPLSGAMDPWALQWANLQVGNPLGAPALEWGLGGGTLRVDAPTCLGFGGAVAVTVNGVAIPTDGPVMVGPGDEVRLTRLITGRFAYLAVRGGIAVPAVLGSAATYLQGGFGGLEGRRLKAGDRLSWGEPVGPVPPAGLPVPAEDPAPPGPLIVRVIPGPQADAFGPATWERFLAQPYQVTPASDRMGYRLSGPELLPQTSATMPSQPTCPGAIQVPDRGQPIVLMADAPTVGGYPMIAVIAAVDRGLAAQRRPGEGVRFQAVTVETAQALLCERLGRFREWESRGR